MSDKLYTYDEVKEFIVHCTEDFSESEEYEDLVAQGTARIAGVAFGLVCEVLDRALSDEGKMQLAEAFADLVVAYACAPDSELNAPGGEA